VLRVGGLAADAAGGPIWSPEARLAASAAGGPIGECVSVGRKVL
jgi:hypothetical protein